MLSRLLNPGLLAIVAVVATFAMRETEYADVAWLPIAAWVAYMLALTIYGYGRFTGGEDARTGARADRVLPTDDEDDAE